MSKLKITPSHLKGEVKIPSSKSQTMRAVLFAALAEGESKIHDYLNSPDTFSMIQALRLFGVTIDVDQKTIVIQGVNGSLKPCENVIDAGNSGQVLRFLGSLSALLPTYTVITGDHSIRHNRPIEPLLSALNQLKAFAVAARLDDQAPIIIKGPLQPGHATLCGKDSQPISGLLIAACFMKGTTHLTVTNPGETPWIDMTLSWLKQLGAKVSHTDYTNYTITGPLYYQGFEMVMPGDFSSAAFPLVAALITNSPLTLKNMDMDEVQGDKKIIDVLIHMGAKIIISKENKTLSVLPGSSIKGKMIDVNEMIDAIAILAVLGCFAEGETEIINAAIARKKESDRIYAIAKELRKMGAEIEEREDGLLIKSSSLVGANVCSHSDHRIAMALIVAALAAKGRSYLDDGSCINKSYPSFINDFQNIGASIEVVE